MTTEGMTELNPSRNAPLLGFWYPACLSSDVAAGKMHPVVVLNLPILICRDSQGKV